jgi:hypothetical protein
VKTVAPQDRAAPILATERALCSGTWSCPAPEGDQNHAHYCPQHSLNRRTCRHCGRGITRTEYGTWQDADNPGYEVCDLADDNGPSHEPEVEQHP